MIRFMFFMLNVISLKEIRFLLITLKDSRAQKEIKCLRNMEFRKKKAKKEKSTTKKIIL